MNKAVKSALQEAGEWLYTDTEAEQLARCMYDCYMESVRAQSALIEG